MADDGMLLNFSIPEGATFNKPVFKGGRWKDRLTARKAAQISQQRKAGNFTGGSTGANTTPVSERIARRNPLPLSQDSGDRGPKRQRTDGEFRPSSNSNATPNLAKKQGGGQESSRGAPKQIISSLFSYNPASTTKDTATEEPKNEAPVEPSNAPLKSELETFTSLGISEILAAHLLNKMELKAPTAIQKAAVSQLLKEDSDAFIQAETGSGKTLSYLLPIVQRIMELSANIKKRKAEAGADAVKRNSGLFAIVLAPTRELSKQIERVLESILRCAHWIVAGTVIGGEKKKSEKARLRKGLNILVATPGRLADHLEHTEALDVSNVRWLVLDEGDRLVELGFEHDIQKIVGALNLRMRAKKDASSRIPGLPEKRTTVLCSATMKMDVERLGQISLKDAVHIQADPADKKEEGQTEKKDSDEGFYAPAQLKQSYAVVAPKLRLVSLIAFLKRNFARKGSVMKAIVFVSCADSVDFHFDIFTSKLSAGTDTEPEEEEKENVPTEAQPAESKDKAKSKNGVVQANPTALTVTYARSPALSQPTHEVTAYRLHGSLPQALRTSTLAHFAKEQEASVLFATDVASRGLDLPNVDLVVEFDPAFAREDHLHRVGRTARAGKDGRACIFLMPGCEEGYISILKSDRKDGESGYHISRHDADEILKKGLVEPGTVQNGVKKSRADRTAYMDRATDLQLDIERWALASPARMEAARRAYQSHVRAYATHVVAERGYFDIKQLHLGHLAKAFALRERPSGMKVPGLRTGAGRDGTAKTSARSQSTGGKKEHGGKGTGAKDVSKNAEGEDEAARMRKAVRAKEKFLRHAGADEFNLG